MKPLLIVYATREGQTRRVIEHIDETLTARAITTCLYDLSSLSLNTDLYFSDYEGVILAASVHDRQHEPEAVAFAKRHSDELNELPCLVLSVSSAQIVAESQQSPEWLRKLASAGADKLLVRFLAETSLLTSHAYPVAGALAFSKYSRRQRWAFRVCAWLARLPADAMHDSAFTDWVAIDRYVDVWLEAVAQHVPRAQRCA